MSGGANGRQAALRLEMRLQEARVAARDLIASELEDGAVAKELTAAHCFQLLDELARQVGPHAALLQGLRDELYHCVYDKTAIGGQSEAAKAWPWVHPDFSPPTLPATHFAVAQRLRADLAQAQADKDALEKQLAAALSENKAGDLVKHNYELVLQNVRDSRAAAVNDTLQLQRELERMREERDVLERDARATAATMHRELTALTARNSTLRAELGDLRVQAHKVQEVTRQFTYAEQARRSRGADAAAPEVDADGLARLCKELAAARNERLDEYDRAHAATVGGSGTAAREQLAAEMAAIAAEETALQDMLVAADYRVADRRELPHSPLWDELADAGGTQPPHPRVFSPAETLERVGALLEDKLLAEEREFSAVQAAAMTDDGRPRVAHQPPPRALGTFLIKTVEAQYAGAGPLVALDTVYSWLSAVQHHAASYSRLRVVSRVLHLEADECLWRYMTVLGSVVAATQLPLGTARQVQLVLDVVYPSSSTSSSSFSFSAEDIAASSDTMEEFLAEKLLAGEDPRVVELSGLVSALDADSAGDVSFSAFFDWITTRVPRCRAMMTSFYRSTALRLKRTKELVPLPPAELALIAATLEAMRLPREKIVE